MPEENKIIPERRACGAVWGACQQWHKVIFWLFAFTECGLAPKPTVSGAGNSQRSAGGVFIVHPIIPDQLNLPFREVLREQPEMDSSIVGRERDSLSMVSAVGNMVNPDWDHNTEDGVSSHILLSESPQCFTKR